jgi:hypothetical protein
MWVAFSKQKAVDILLRFLRTSTEHLIRNCDFNFVMLLFSSLARNGVQLNFEYHRVVHCKSDYCCQQAVRSVMRFPRSSYRDVQRPGSRSVHLNAEVCCRREGAEASSRGKLPVFILLLVAICDRCCCVCLFVCFFLSGPAHILCLTVASGWNKERCKPSIFVSLLYLITTHEWL